MAKRDLNEIIDILSKGASPTRVKALPAMEPPEWWPAELLAPVMIDVPDAGERTVMFRDENNRVTLLFHDPSAPSGYSAMSASDWQKLYHEKTDPLRGQADRSQFIGEYGDKGNARVFAAKDVSAALLDEAGVDLKAREKPRVKAEFEQKAVKPPVVVEREEPAHKAQVSVEPPPIDKPAVIEQVAVIGKTDFYNFIDGYEDGTAPKACDKEDSKTVRELRGEVRALRSALERLERFEDRGADEARLNEMRSEINEKFETFKSHFDDLDETLKSAAVSYLSLIMDDKGRDAAIYLKSLSDDFSSDKNVRNSAPNLDASWNNSAHVEGGGVRRDEANEAVPAKIVQPPSSEF